MCEYVEANLEGQNRLLAQVQQDTHDWTIVIDRESRIIFVNESFLRIYEYQEAELIGQNADALRHTVEPAIVDQLQFAIQEGDSARLIWIVTRSGLKIRALFKTSIVRDEIGNVLAVVGTVRDASQPLGQEAELRRLNRALRTLSQCNQAIVHSTSEQELIDSVCRILVEIGGYRMAWIGYPEDCAEKVVQPRAKAGYEEGYLETARITWADDLFAAGPSGKAIRSGKLVVNSTTQSDRAVYPWRKEGLKRGYLSSIALPLLNGGNTLGVLSLYAADPDAFDREEVKLLSELADDVSFGIDTQRIRAEHKRTEAALLESERRYRDFISHANEGVWRFELDDPLPIEMPEDKAEEWLLQHAYMAECNLAHAENCGHASPDSLIGRYLKDLIAPSDTHSFERIRESIRGNWQARTGESESHDREGNSRWLRKTEVPIIEDAKLVRVWGMTADITERKRAEEELRREKTFTEAVIDSLPDIFCVIKPTGQFLHWGRNPERILGYSNGDTCSMESAVDIVAKEDRALAAVKIQEAFTVGSSEVELRLLHKDGRQIPYLLRGTRATIGNDTYLIAIGLDICERKRVEDALRASEAQLREAEQIARLGHCIWNVDMDTAIWSEEMYRITGRDPILKPPRHAECQAIYTAESWTELELAVKHAVRTGEPYDLELEIVRPDGGLRWAHARGIAVSDESGRVIRLRCTLQDITDRKTAERALRESEARFRTLIEDAPLAVGISRDAEGLYANKAFLQMFGLQSVDEVFGHQLSERWAPECRFEIERRAHLRSAGHDASTTFEGIGIRKDGSRFNLHVDVTVVTLPDGPATLGFLRDISEQKRAQESLVRLRKAVDSSSEVIFMTDQNGLITFVNPEFTRLYGYEAEDVVGKENQRILMADEVDAAEYDGFSQAAQSRQSVDGEIINKTKNGQKVILQRSVNAIHDGNGETAGFISMQRDISARKRLEQQFLQAQKMEAVGHLAGGLAHDFNNILGIIIGYADLILLDPSLLEGPRSRLQEIKKAADRGAAVTRQLLAFSRKQLLQSKIMDLNEVVKDTVEMLGRLLREDIELETELAPDLGMIHADPTGIDQIILNLAVNARDAMPDGGKLTIESANVRFDADVLNPELPAGDYVLLAVSDTGIGMDSEIQRHIFEPFFTTKGREQGTGLGLSTVYGIVKQSSGHIRIYSEIGQGTTFKVYFPRVRDTSLPTSAEPPVVRYGAGEAILLVEDDSRLRELNTELLQNLGYTVIPAADGNQAMEVAANRSGALNLLMTDVIMPGMNGQQLAERLVTANPGLKVLFVSGYTGAAIREKISASQAAFLQKPFTRIALAQKLGELLDA